MVTAETLTDEQIWSLYNEGLINAYTCMMARSQSVGWRAEFRSICAAAINARAKAGR
jgi:hypothetical protein